MKNVYYFSFAINFKKDIDLKKLEKILGITATKLTPLKQSPLPEGQKTALFYYKTEEMSEIYSDDEFEKFLFKMSKRLVDLPQIMQEFDGECGFAMVFTQVEEPPCISLSTEAIEMLHNLGARFDVDHA